MVILYLQIMTSKHTEIQFMEAKLKMLKTNTCEKHKKYLEILQMTRIWQGSNILVYVF